MKIKIIIKVCLVVYFALVPLVFAAEWDYSIYEPLSHPMKVYKLSSAALDFKVGEVDCTISPLNSKHNEIESREVVCDVGSYKVATEASCIKKAGSLSSDAQTLKLYSNKKVYSIILSCHYR